MSDTIASCRATFSSAEFSLMITLSFSEYYSRHWQVDFRQLAATITPPYFHADSFRRAAAISDYAAAMPLRHAVSLP